MAELLLPNVPDVLIRRFEELAKADDVPVATKTVRLLETAVRSRPIAAQGAELGAMLRSIERNRVVPPPGTPDAVELLREGRDER